MVLASGPRPKGDRDDEPKRGSSGGERDDLVVDEAVLAGRRHHLHIAEGRGLALVRDDPDRAGRPEPWPERGQDRQLVGRIGREEDEVGVRFRTPVRDVARPFQELVPEARGLVGLVVERPTIAMRIPGRTPSLSRSGVV